MSTRSPFAYGPSGRLLTSTAGHEVFCCNGDDEAPYFVHAMDGAVDRLDDEVADLGTRWEILDTGVTVKLYPSCAGTHPTIDVLLDLRAELGFTADAV